MALQYSPEAQIAMHAASSLAGFYRKGTLTAELLLLTLTQDDAVRAVWPEAADLDAVLEARILADESPGDKDGWSAPAKRALHAAWDRAGARRRFVGPGDLLSGLAGAGGLAGELLSRSAVAYADVDAASSAHSAAASPPGSVVLYDDSTTPMDFVVATLREVLGCTQPRAVHYMYRTHFVGKATVGPFADAPDRVRRALQMAREAGFPLRVEMVATT